MLTDYQDDMPELVGTAVEKRAQFKMWMDSYYPNDIRMTREQAKAFVEAPFGHRGAYICTVQTDTDARLLKTNNPHPKARKRSRCQVIGGNWSYKNAVNNARIKTWDQHDGPIFEDGTHRPPTNEEGQVEEFQPEPRKWGTRVEGTPWVQHKDSLYLELRMLRSVGHEYYDETGTLDGETVRPFLPKKSSNSGHQGVSTENEVILRDYGWENIKVITYAGRNIHIAD